jgi:hypothetical protein
MYLPVLRPAFTQLLHANRCNDSKSCRFESGSAFVDGDVGCDAHLRDEIEILLITVWMLVLRDYMGKRRRHTIHCRLGSA